MTFDLDRFVDAQAGVHRDVVEELRAGRKTGHWIWFTFPQIAGLGRSGMSERYAIASLAEARAYLAHPILGPRLRECAGLLLAIEGRTAAEILGDLDAMKVRSSMTLFHRTTRCSQRSWIASTAAARMRRPTSAWPGPSCDLHGRC